MTSAKPGSKDGIADVLEIDLPASLVQTLVQTGEVVVASSLSA
jgi:hypothetical protein